MTFIPGGVQGLKNSGVQPNPLDHQTTTEAQVEIDAANRLATYSLVCSDKGSFRDDFSGSSLTTALTGTLTFTASSTAITGASTKFTTEIGVGQYIKKTADAETLYAQVASVQSDTALTLVAAYTGTSTATTGVVSNWMTTTAATGGSISVASSVLSLAIGAVSGQRTLIQRGSVIPYTLPFAHHSQAITISQRVANQGIFFGLRDQAASPNKRCEIYFSGTDNTKVSLITASSSAASDVQTTTITLPNGTTTLTAHNYEVDLTQNAAILVVDGQVLVNNSAHIPGPYDSLQVFEGIENTGTASGTTTIQIDFASLFNVTRTQVENVFAGDPVQITGAITQNVIADLVNSSTAQILALGTFTGQWANTLGVSGLQINFYCDQNCTIYIDQGNNQSTTDVTNTFNYNALKGGIAFTTQATGAYWRIRVTNITSTNTTVVRLYAYLCPIVECLPQSLDQNLNLKVAAYGLNDVYGNSIKSDSVGSLRVEEPYRLVGSTFSGASLDANYWVGTTSGTGSSVTPANGIVTLQSTTTGAGYAQLQTPKLARFITDNPGLFRFVGRMTNLAVANTNRPLGPYTSSAGAPADGFAFSFSAAGVLSVNCYNSTGAGSQSVSSGSFNGQSSQFTMDTNVHTYEIIFNRSKALFFIDNVLIHTMVPTTAMMSSVFHLPATVITANPAGAGAQTQAGIEVWSCSILRLGRPSSASVWSHIHGANAGLVLKNGPGTLKSVSVTGWVNGSTISLYDAVSATNAISLIVPTTTGGTHQEVPFEMVYGGGIDFNVGLYIVVVGGTTDVTLNFE